MSVCVFVFGWLRVRPVYLGVGLCLKDSFVPVGVSSCVTIWHINILTLALKCNGFYITAITSDEGNKNTLPR